MKPNLISICIQRSNGSTLMEVLVAVVIMSFGIAGVAKMQVTGQIYNYSALNRTQAAILAYEFTDLMRANIDRTTPSSPAIASAFTSFDSATVYTKTANCLTTSSCTSSQMANNDLAIWKESLTSALSSSATATIDSSAAPNYILTISWKGFQSLNDGSDPSFEINFRL